MSRKEHNIKIVKQFEMEHQRKPFDLHEVYQWASAKGLWFPPRDLAERRFIEEVAQTLREEYIAADDGSRVRYYHAVTQGRQGTLWANLDTGTKSHLSEGFKQRRQQSLGDCRQLKSDVDYCNSKRFNDTPIPMSFNFDLDLAEEEAYKNIKKKAKGSGV
jgi:hypothetical protein